jgi:hypothetical protein
MKNNAALLEPMMAQISEVFSILSTPTKHPIA